MRKGKKKRIGLTIFLVLGIALCISIVVSNTLIVVTEYTIASAKLPASFSGFRIVQVSDLHSKDFGNYLIRQIQQQRPDIVVMTGDMVNSYDSGFQTFLTFAEQVSDQYETYYIVGNHEQILKESKREELLHRLTAMGITVLDNTSVELSRDGDVIDLYGMWFNLRYYKDVTAEYTQDIMFTEKTMVQILGSANPSHFTLLLTHNPLYFSAYAAWGADLTLAGHIHGGMIRIPFVGGLFSPEKDIFPKYSGGLYALGQRQMVVNRGLGNGGLGFRIANCPDLSVITLIRS